jgi:hypothetical protein
MNWAAIRTTLLDVVRLVDGLDHSGAVEWADTAQASYARSYPRVDLSIRSVLHYGTSEQRIEVSELDDRIEYISGPRRLTWQVRVESDQASLGEAVYIADRIRSQINRRDAYALLLDAGLAVSEAMPIQVIDFEKDGRKYTVAVLDMYVNAAENTQDDSDYAGETIEQVSLASEYIRDPDGGISTNQVSDEVSSSD